MSASSMSSRSELTNFPVRIELWDGSALPRICYAPVIYHCAPCYLLLTSPNSHHVMLLTNLRSTRRTCSATVAGTVPSLNTHAFSSSTLSRNPAETLQNLTIGLCSLNMHDKRGVSIFARVTGPMVRGCSVCCTAGSHTT